MKYNQFSVWTAQVSALLPELPVTTSTCYEQESNPVCIRQLVSINIHRAQLSKLCMFHRERFHPLQRNKLDPVSGQE